MRIRRALEITLGLIVLVLLWEIGATWRRPLPSALPVPPTKTGPTAVLPAPARVTPDSLAPQVQMIVAKNLFDPQRGRVEVVAPPEEGPKEVPPPSHLKLVGIMVSHSRAEAMFSDASQGGKAVRVKQGETLGAYQLTAVTPTSAKLALGAGGGEVTLSLVILESSAAAQAPNMIPTMNPQSEDEQARSRALLSRGGGQELTPNPNEVDPQQEEAQALRENIQQMQQRLRQIRRRAAIEEARSRGEYVEEENAEEESE